MSIGVISVIGACIVVGIIIVTILALRRIVPTNQVHIVQRNNKTVSYGKDTANGNVYYEIPSLPILPFHPFTITNNNIPNTTVVITLASIP